MGCVILKKKAGTASLPIPNSFCLVIFDGLDGHSQTKQDVFAVLTIYSLSKLKPGTNNKEMLVGIDKEDLTNL